MPCDCCGKKSIFLPFHQLYTLDYGIGLKREILCEVCYMWASHFFVFYRASRLWS